MVKNKALDIADAVFGAFLFFYPHNRGGMLLDEFSSLTPEIPNDCPATPHGLDIVVYDLEIKTPIDGVNVTWDQHERMGISVGCALDYLTGDISVYFEKDIPRLVERLNRASLVVGFNTVGFDNLLLRRCGHKLAPDDALFNYDILIHSRQAVGWTPGSRNFPKGMKLDNHLEAMYGEKLMKTGHGELAPKLYQSGQLGELASYCVADVRREAMVFENIWTRGFVATLSHGVRFLEHPSHSLRGAHANEPLR